MVNYISLSSLLLVVGVALIIAGIPMAFSKKERERIQKRVIAELPERSAFTGSSEALKIAQNRGFIMLALGLALVAIWLAKTLIL